MAILADGAAWEPAIPGPVTDTTEGSYSQTGAGETGAGTYEPATPVPTTTTTTSPGDPGTYEPPPPGPVTPPPTTDENGDPISILDGGSMDTPPVTGDPISTDTTGAPTTVQDLYPEMPEIDSIDVPDIPDPNEIPVVEGDMSVTETDAAQAETNTGDIVQGAINEVTDAAGTPEQSTLTPEQQVDAELARILGKDSPLLARARQEAMRVMNSRGLTNTSMAAGATYGAMVDAALPMAQQNADQAFQRTLENTRLRQETGQFTAEQIERLRTVEAELGQELNIFNVEQLNNLEGIMAELRTAIARDDAAAYNNANIKLADLIRDVDSQRAEMAYGAEERDSIAQQAYNENIIQGVTTLNEQWMIGEQQIDLENIRGQYNVIISTNETAGGFYNNYLTSIGDILSNENLSSAQAGEAIRTLVDGLEAGLSMIEGINGLDFGLDEPGVIPGVPNDYTTPIPGGDVMGGTGDYSNVPFGGNDYSEGSYNATETQPSPPEPAPTPAPGVPAPGV